MKHKEIEMLSTYILSLFNALKKMRKQKRGSQPLIVADLGCGFLFSCKCFLHPQINIILRTPECAGDNNEKKHLPGSRFRE